MCFKKRWYLSGGIRAKNCLAAYQPIGAASKNASFINLANPGVNDAFSSAPDALGWDAVNGWINTWPFIFCGGIAATKDTTMLVRFSDLEQADSHICGGGWVENSLFYGRIREGYGWYYVYGSYTGIPVAPYANSGVWGMAGNLGYRNGILDYTSPGLFTGVSNVLRIGHSGIGGSVGKYQAAAIYNVILSPEQMIAVSNAMLAL